MLGKKRKKISCLGHTRKLEKYPNASKTPFTFGFDAVYHSTYSISYICQCMQNENLKFHRSTVGCFAAKIVYDNQSMSHNLRNSRLSYMFFVKRSSHVLSLGINHHIKTQRSIACSENNENGRDSGGTSKIDSRNSIPKFFCIF